MYSAIGGLGWRRRRTPAKRITQSSVPYQSQRPQKRLMGSMKGIPEAKERVIARL